MTTADLLCADDRCERSAYWSLSHERWSLHPNDILRRSIDEALTAETEDSGQYAGDSVMTYFSNRGVDTKQNDLYGMGVHLASLADIIVSVLRGDRKPYERPEDTRLGEHVWNSGCLRDASGTRLHRVLVVDRLSAERLEAEKHSWRQLGEVCAYEMPLTMTVVMVGQTRDGRHSSPWAKGYLHTVGNQNLRFRKRDGSGLSGSGWKQVFREDCDRFSRDFWIDKMQEDGVLDDLIVKAEIPVPAKEVLVKVRSLAEKKLARIDATKTTPDPRPSVCDFPSPCQFRSVCWQFQKSPEQVQGFVKVDIPWVQMEEASSE